MVFDGKVSFLMSLDANANNNLLTLMNALKKVVVTNELIERNQSSMVGNRNETIYF